MALNWNKIIAVSDDGTVNAFGIERVILTTGQKGDQGVKGDPGDAATIESVNAVTLPPYSDAYAVNEGTPTNARLLFGIPKGDPGGTVWGNITGQLENQTDLYTALDGKADASNVYGRTQIDNMLDGKSDIDHTHDGRYYTETEMDVFLFLKQDTLTFDSTPTASSTNPVESGGVKSYVDKKILYFTSQTVSAATNAQIMRIPASGTNSNITTDTVVLECTFADPSKVTSNVSWTSYAGYITFSGTCTASTTANVTLGTKGN